MDHPFELPQYINTGARPFIRFKVWDIGKNMLVRKKVETKDLAYARELLQEITENLVAGNVIDSRAKNQKTIFVLTIKEAFRIFLNEKNLQLESTSIQSYESHARMFQNWCALENIISTPLSELTREQVNNFLNYSQREFGNSNTSRNIKRNFIKTFLNFFIERGDITANPAEKIKKLNQEPARKVAFSIEQIQEVREILKKEYLDLYYVSSIIFYSFIRPKELRFLKVTDIDFRMNKIIIDASIAKTNQGYVQITPPLREIFLEMGVDKRKSGFLFEKNFQKMAEDHYSKAHRRIMDKYGYDAGYVLYSWKHTGIKEHFLAGNSIRWIQKQCRHKDLQTTIDYLELGLGIDIDDIHAYKNPKL